ncbi:FecR family protein [Tannerella sp.]|uniref:FecR family protein n=1 Tax=Tannerella sp. TaxID=2382127 RepID=UPI0026DB490B|nr:FecR domain-containing protein [Tannerella sp.]MDO4702788.1 DUF4974 domain-containing protein [Tannerella sp.]
MERNIEILIAKLFNGTISETEEEQLKNWYNESAANKSAFVQMKSVWDATRPAFPVWTVNTDQAEATIWKKINRKQPKRMAFPIWWQRVSAVIVVPLLLLSVYLLLSRHTAKDATCSYQEIMAPLGTYSRISLSDGSTVWLNSGSKLSYMLPFKQETRETYLAGEAFFEVEADPKHPFIVIAGDMRINATGTRFNVEAYPSDTLCAVTLERGRVSVDLPHREGIREVKVGGQFVWNKNTGKGNCRQVDPLLYGKWREGVLIFHDESLENIFKRVARTYNVDICVKDPALAKQRYRATFEQESLDEILELLRISAPIRYDFKGDRRNPKKIINVYHKNQAL